MVGPGRIPGQYNLIVEGAYDQFDLQLPVPEFTKRLEKDDVPDTVSVVGLGEAFVDGDMVDQLKAAMSDRVTDLEYQSPTIQFVVKESFHRRGKSFDLRFEDELYDLQRLFGPRVTREGTDWLAAPFTI
ncbi:hypothetical protein ACFQL9_13240 [Halobaculum lipolyticum]|uniref:DUF8076 domain-containing protein n=1 Tax=Halobaculum lipolyticum TaxID=3032001 RepID=A0ABD5WBG0_9EURY